MRMIVAFQKTEQVRHIGHLDMQRAMQRALRRSGLPIRYSNGFNPHALLSFGSPLAVGVGGDEELFEVGVEPNATEEMFRKALPQALPASLPMVDVRLVPDDHPKLMAALMTASYEARMDKCAASEAMAANVEALLARTEIQALRKTKSTEKLCDIRPMLHELSASEDCDEIVFSMRVDAMEQMALKPDLLLKTLAEQTEVELPKYWLHRVKLWGERDRLPVALMEL